MLKTLPYGNRTSITAAGGAVTSFEVSARAKRNPHFFPYCPATRSALLMGPQEDAEIILFVASWPAARVSRWDESCHQLAGRAMGPKWQGHLGPRVPSTKWGL
jgi:hypothetical protein